MARQVFYSFHYDNDNWRASQVRNIGVIEGNVPARDNDWETIKKGGDSAIQKWIDDQLYGRSCAIVLVGSGTANRKWINYEIEKAWNSGKGVVGIHIHNLKDSSGRQSFMGTSPFIRYIGNIWLPDAIKLYNPPYLDSKEVYSHISNNISGWVDEAISIRSKY